MILALAGWLMCNIMLITLIYKTSLFISTFGIGNLGGLSNKCVCSLRLWVTSGATNTLFFCGMSNKNAGELTWGTGQPMTWMQQNRARDGQKHSMCEVFTSGSSSSGLTGEITDRLAELTSHMWHDGSFADPLKITGGQQVAHSKNKWLQKDA